VVKKQEDNIAKGWKDKIAEGSTPLIPFGLKYNNLMINPGDAQYLDSIEATKEDIYAIFRVPPTLAQNYDRTPYNTAEQQDLVYLKYTMLPIVTNIEQECNAKLFSEANNTSETPFYVKFNTNAFMRGDFKTRTEGYRTLWQMGAINGDHIAELEDWVKWEGGDERFVPMNMIPLSKMDEFLSSLTKPVDSTAGDPGGDPDERMLDKIEKLMKRNGHVNGHAN
jgi:HK97 family phage portal protein